MVSRVVDVQRDRVTVLTEAGSQQPLMLPPDLVAPDGLPVTVGDWVIIDPDGARVQSIVERRSLISRQAAGSERRMQPIAANVDTLFVVTSCNDDFNPSRLERYLAIARQARVSAVIVLTKRDLCADPDVFVTRAAQVHGRAEVVAVDATSHAGVATLASRIGEGRTVAFVGSSGVGKSTLVNTLMRGGVQRTGAIREADARGRHTTTSRHLFALPQGAWVIDTPGMRELAIGAVSADALEDVFEELAHLARLCRFRDCRHEGDAGCALEAAVAADALDARRLASYLKLRREAERATRTTVERRAGERRFGRMAKDVMRDKRRRREE